jgi:hypothetical protein
MPLLRPRAGPTLKNNRAANLFRRGRNRAEVAMARTLPRKGWLLELVRLTAVKRRSHRWRETASNLWSLSGAVPLPLARSAKS